MIQCVGPAERFCSRICCTQALKNALKLKELNPRAQITVIYRDIRTYGFKERLYAQARQAGVLFVRYDFERKPEVIRNGTTGEKEGDLTVRVWEPVLGKSEPDDAYVEAEKLLAACCSLEIGAIVMCRRPSGRSAR